MNIGDSLGKTGRKMDQAWKDAISAGKKAGAKAGSTLARGVVATTSKGFRTRALNIGGLAVGLGSYGAAIGGAHLGAYGGLAGGINKAVSKMPIKKSYNAQFKQELTALKKAGNGVATIGKRHLPVGVVTGAKMGAKTGVKIVGGAALVGGGILGAVDKQQKLGKSLNRKIERVAKRNK